MVYERFLFILWGGGGIPDKYRQTWTFFTFWVDVPLSIRPPLPVETPLLTLLSGSQNITIIPCDKKGVRGHFLKPSDSFMNSRTSSVTDVPLRLASSETGFSLGLISFSSENLLERCYQI